MEIIGTIFIALAFIQPLFSIPFFMKELQPAEYIDKLYAVLASAIITITLLLVGTGFLFTPKIIAKDFNPNKMNKTSNIMTFIMGSMFIAYIIVVAHAQNNKYSVQSTLTENIAMALSIIIPLTIACTILTQSAKPLNVRIVIALLIGIPLFIFLFFLLGVATFSVGI